MTRKATTVRIPEELADTAEVVARARGVSVNTLILDALQSEVDRVKKDKQFMALAPPTATATERPVARRWLPSRSSTDRVPQRREAL